MRAVISKQQLDWLVNMACAVAARKIDGSKDFIFSDMNGMMLRM